MLHTLEKFTVYTLDMAVLFGVSTTSPEEACAQVDHIHTLLSFWHFFFFTSSMVLNCSKYVQNDSMSHADYVKCSWLIHFLLLQLFCEAKRTAPSILYIPHMQRWWDTVSSALRATFLSLLQGIPSFSPILLLASCSLPYHSLYTEVRMTLITRARTTAAASPICVKLPVILVCKTGTSGLACQCR